jgi:crotonobetainyl-CoA:carnitine CoA-transferase CaiB-like acyl-CoA transferase
MQLLSMRKFVHAVICIARTRAQILAALLQRHRTGRGCWIDVAMTDWTFALMAMAQAKHLACGEAIGGGKDLLSGAVPCYDVYRTKDGHITVRLLTLSKKL